jgi:hypothetical protein
MFFAREPATNPVAILYELAARDIARDTPVVSPLRVASILQVPFAFHVTFPLASTSQRLRLLLLKVGTPEDIAEAQFILKLVVRPELLTTL